MKKSITIISWIVEAAIMVGLIWRHSHIYDVNIAVVLLLLSSPLLAFAHWKTLKKEHQENHLGQSIRLKLFFLTGPALILSFSLMLFKDCDLARLMSVGFTKEIAAGLRSDGVVYEDGKQWQEKAIKKISSDAIVNTMFFACFCLLYASRYYSGKQNAIDDAAIPKVSEQAKLDQSP